jgi:RNA polymerase sigma factor for flagellar operon FliA
MTINEQALIAEHTETVKKIAGMFKKRLPQHVGFNEIYQTGLIGLWKAAHDYDPTKGASFSTYAGIRIRGEIMDEIREYSDRTRRGIPKFERVEFDESECEDIDQSMTMGDPCEQLEKQQLERVIEQAIEKLTPREAETLSLYQSGSTLYEIGALFGVSESRACQLLTRAKRTIRKNLANSK